MKRCFWCNEKNLKYIEYHDNEWGVPVHDDTLLLEMLTLEMFHSGLSWEIVLNKRDNFKSAFKEYNLEDFCSMTEQDIEELLNNTGIVRHRKKIESAINNAKVFKKIQEEFESFSKYIWSFTDNKIIYETTKTKSNLSDIILKDLKMRGMKFLGSTTVYAYLQAVGIINSHDKDCFCHKLKNKGAI